MVNGNVSDDRDNVPLVISTTLPFELVDVETDYEKANK